MDRRTFIKQSSITLGVAVVTANSAVALTDGLVLMPDSYSSLVPTKKNRTSQPAIYADFLYNDFTGDVESYTPPSTFAGDFVNRCEEMPMSDEELYRYLFV